MKKVRNMLMLVVAPAACAVLTGCEGISGIPYRTNTAAAAILGDRPAQAPTGAASASLSADSNTNREDHVSAPIVVPVEAGDAESRRYLSFSPVLVHLEGEPSQRTVRVFTDVRPKPLTWRVRLIKDGKEYYSFIAGNQSHLMGQAIPLNPLALEPNLPVPDKVVVTLVE